MADNEDSSGLPSVEWTQLLDSSDYADDYGKALTIGLDESIYIGGSTYGDLDGQINNAGQDSFISKFTSDGEIEWTSLLSSSTSTYLTALTIGEDGKIYIAGSTDGELDGQTFNGGESDAFIAEFTPEGEKEWTRVFGSAYDDYTEFLISGNGAIYHFIDTYYDPSSSGFLNKFTSVDPITGVNANEKVTFDASEYAAENPGGSLIDSSNDAAAGDAIVVHQISDGDIDSRAAVDAGANVIYFTDTDKNAFSDFTFSYELDANAGNAADGIIAVFYDADGGFANFGVITDASSSVNAMFNSDEAIFNSYTQTAMTATDYGSLTNTNFAIQA